MLKGFQRIMTICVEPQLRHNWKAILL